MTLETLTPSQLEVRQMHKDGMSISAIATQLGRNESSIRERLAFAKRKMEADTDPSIVEAMKEMGIKTVPRQVWFKNDKFSIQVRPDAARDHHSASHGYISFRQMTSMGFDLRSKKHDYSELI